MLLLTTAMKPLSDRTTPRRLMAPISRHFLPVLQPEPPAWLTTGLMKGSRLPFALYLLSGTAGSSFGPLSPSPETPLPAALEAAGGLFEGAMLTGTGTAGFACALRLTPISGTRLAPPMFFAPAGLAPACAEGDFTGAPAAAPLGLAGACAGAALPVLNGDAPVLT